MNAKPGKPNYGIYSKSIWQLLFQFSLEFKNEYVDRETNYEARSNKN